ncbi:hypothetical protein B2M20_07820 [Nitrobacter vulgaris]|uniref:Uncharacterized protein n=1 Tax=Nitrobacter vulgaris TaxID=29421 RepID=A0A1V4HZF7_NITVU|nr:hypothetical protein B2M20_07820 [Nitrobacter vulgaris]
MLEHNVAMPLEQLHDAPEDPLALLAVRERLDVGPDAAIGGDRLGEFEARLELATPLEQRLVTERVGRLPCLH